MSQAERVGKRGVRLHREGIVEGACQKDGTRTARSHVGVADRGRASGLYRVGITGTESHASPFTEWSKIRDCNGDFKVLNGHEQCRSKGIV
jgi:hypothetical protein